jgi:exodeoxyribonuclease V alpha subunit
VLVGDQNQLPSVGPGNVLADIIASGRVTSTALTRIFRQQNDSDIVRVAHGMLTGEVPTSGGENGDFFFVEAEDGTARALDALVKSKAARLPVQPESAVRWFAQVSGMELAEQQQDAIVRGLRERVSVITGGPGVGKTTIVRALVQILGQKDLKVSLAAPTGRAAKRLEESTGHHASTLHRLLEFTPGANRFARDEDNPLEGDLLVVDEASMLDVQLAHSLLRELIGSRIPRKFGLDPLRDVQVLCPMYRGEVGADALNRDLQDLLNPGEIEVERSGKRYRIGDKVMQIRNDYDREVWNGDVGQLTYIDTNAANLYVRFPEREHQYGFEELGDLIPAYAISVHRSQGSEYPAVVMPVTTDHFLMLRRSLLYTAITRGKKLVVLVGSRRALEMATRNNDDGRRWSGLCERLRDLVRHDGVHPTVDDAQEGGLEA